LRDFGASTWNNPKAVHGRQMRPATSAIHGGSWAGSACFIDYDCAGRAESSDDDGVRRACPSSITAACPAGHVLRSWLISTKSGAEAFIKDALKSSMAAIRNCSDGALLGPAQDSYPRCHAGLRCCTPHCSCNQRRQPIVHGISAAFEGTPDIHRLSLPSGNMRIGAIGPPSAPSETIHDAATIFLANRMSVLLRLDRD